MSDQVPNLPGKLVEPGGTQTRARDTRDGWLTPQALDLGRRRPGHLLETTRPQARTRVARDTWSTPRALGQGPKSLMTAGLPRGELGKKCESPRTAL